MDKSLSKLLELVMDREARHAAVHGVANRHDRAELNDWVYLFLFSGTHTWKQGHCINKQRKVYMYRHRYVCLCTQICIHARTYSLLQHAAAAAAVKSLQSCPTLSDPMDCSLPGSSIHGIFQARVLEWGAIAFSLLQHTPLPKFCFKSL